MLCSTPLCPPPRCSPSPSWRASGRARRSRASAALRARPPLPTRRCASQPTCGCGSSQSSCPTPPSTACSRARTWPTCARAAPSTNSRRRRSRSWPAASQTSTVGQGGGRGEGRALKPSLRWAMGGERAGWRCGTSPPPLRTGRRGRRVRLPARLRVPAPARAAPPRRAHDAPQGDARHRPLLAGKGEGGRRRPFPFLCALTAPASPPTISS